MSNYITDFLKINNHIETNNGIKAVDILSAMGRDTTDNSRKGHLKAEIRRYRVL